jgi:hypothetical protein
LAHEVKPGTCIVDLGTWRGLAAFALALGSDPSVVIHTLDDYGDRRVEEVSDVGLRYNPADLEQFLGNLDKMPADIQARISQHRWEVRGAADTWTKPVGLLFWDIWGERLIDDIKAWTPHVVEGGIVAVKVFEDGRLQHERLYDLPGLTPYKAFPEGAVYAMRKNAQPEPLPSVGTVVWIVDGDKYFEEARRSAESVARHMPQLEQKIYSPFEREHAEWFIESTQLLTKVLDSLPEGEKVLWLDSDTYMLEPVPELFDMLDRFDMVLAHAPGHVTAPTVNPIPAAFPEFNIGVIAMWNNPNVRRMWKEVYEMQVSNKGVYGDNDQSPLREYLYDHPHSTHYAVMPWEYNCRWTIGTFLREPVKILHGRANSAEEYEDVARQLNEAFRVSR